MVNFEQTVVVEFDDMSKDIQDALIDFYQGTDLSINRGSYQRFPYLCDLDYELIQNHKVTKWLIDNGVKSEFVIIHFDY